MSHELIVHLPANSDGVETHVTISSYQPHILIADYFDTPAVADAFRREVAEHPEEWNLVEVSTVDKVSEFRGSLYDIYKLLDNENVTTYDKLSSPLKANVLLLENPEDVLSSPEGKEDLSTLLRLGRAAGLHVVLFAKTMAEFEAEHEDLLHNLYFPKGL